MAIFLDRGLEIRFRLSPRWRPESFAASDGVGECKRGYHNRRQEPGAAAGKTAPFLFLSLVVEVAAGAARLGGLLRLAGFASGAGLLKA